MRNEDIIFEQILINIVLKIFENLLKFMEKDQIIEGIDIIINAYMN